MERCSGITENIEIEVTVDTSELDEAEAKSKKVLAETKETIEEVENQTKISFNKVMLAARGAYMMAAGIIRATGGTVFLWKKTY